MLISISRKGVITNSPVTGNYLYAGGSLQSGDATLCGINNILFDDLGALVIKGSGSVIGGNNPTNTLLDELLIVDSRPLISESSTPLFSRIFTKDVTFDFEIVLRTTSTIKLVFSDGIVVIGTLPLSISSGTQHIIASKYGSVSGLYTISISNYYSEYVS